MFKPSNGGDFTKTLKKTLKILRSLEVSRTREADLESKLVKGIKKLGGRAYKWVSPGCAGVPDRIIILPGPRVIFAELKTDAGKLSQLQKRQIEALRSLGCDARIVWGLQGVRDLLEELQD